MEAMHEHLDHPSQRLIHDILSFIMDVSDVPTVNRDLTPLLTKLLQFLGTADPEVNRFCINIIRYISWQISAHFQFLDILVTCWRITQETKNFWFKMELYPLFFCTSERQKIVVINQMSTLNIWTSFIVLRMKC